MSSDFTPRTDAVIAQGAAGQAGNLAILSRQLESELNALNRWISAVTRTLTSKDDSVDATFILHGPNLTLSEVNWAAVRDAEKNWRELDAARAALLDYVKTSHGFECGCNRCQKHYVAIEAAREKEFRK